MGEVICTVIVKGKQTDLVLPDNVPAHLLTRSICSALKIDVKENQAIELYQVENDGDRLIRGSWTLSHAKILNGSYLRLIPRTGNDQRLAYLVGPREIHFQLYQQNKIGRSSNTVEQDIDLTPLDQNSVVSRNHAVIFYKEGNYWINDSGSKNGTFINGQQIFGFPVALKTHDVLHFGSIKRGVKLIFVHM